MKLITSLSQSNDGGNFCFHIRRMRRLANNVKKAKDFAVFPGKPVTFEGSPKSANKGQGSICFFVTKEKQLKIDHQKEVMDGHKQILDLQGPDGNDHKEDQYQA